MASVLFSTVGQAVGGPLGAGIGAAVGSSIDAGVLRRSRPGAQDGFVTRSAYGEVVPLVFGRTRVGGHLIWATPPAAAGSKGEGRRARSTSFAMAVSRGPIRSIARIWADGSLLRNAEGDLLTDAVFRLHCAGKGEVDPLIAAAEGPTAPAYVHLSYIVFENFDLGPYGNRIPSLSFEVDAGGELVFGWLGQLTKGLGAELDARPARPSIDGYAARLEPFSEDLAALLGAAGCNVGARDGQLTIVSTPRIAALSPADLVRVGSDADSEAVVRHDVRPSGYGLAFQDSDRDYQVGWQQELRNRRGATLSASWSASATAPIARSIAHRLLQEAEAGAETISFSVPHLFLETSLGDAVDFGDGKHWLVVRREVRGLTMLLEGRRLPSPSSHAALPTDAGRILPPCSAPAPPSVWKLIEPPVPIWPRSQAAVLLAVSGGAGWQGAEVQLLQGGDELPLGTVQEGLPFGVLADDLDPGPDMIWDERASLVLNVIDQDAPFLSRTHRDVLDGGGILCVGDELLQYRHAELLGSGQVRLSGLLRGRFGTGASGAPAGSMVIAIPRAGGAWVDVDAAMLGAELMFLIGGRGDPIGGWPALHQVNGAGTAPLAPVHVRGERRPDGAVMCSWVDRDRANFRWESPQVAEPPRRYAWHFRAGDGSTHSLDVDSNGIWMDVGEQQAAFGRSLPIGEFRVEALGDGPESVRLSRWMAI